MFAVKLAIRNGPLYQTIYGRYKSASEFCRQCGIPPRVLNRYMTLKELPMTRDGTWRPGAQRIADALHMLPEDLWPDAVQITLEKSTGIGYFEADQIERLVDMSRDRFESQQLAGHLLECLTNREKDVIRRRFEDDQLLNDIAKDLDVSRTRVQQIEAKAMRKLRAQAVKENIINPFVE